MLKVIINTLSIILVLSLLLVVSIKSIEQQLIPCNGILCSTEVRQTSGYCSDFNLCPGPTKYNILHLTPIFYIVFLFLSLATILLTTKLIQKLPDKLALKVTIIITLVLTTPIALISTLAVIHYFYRL